MRRTTIRPVAEGDLAALTAIYNRYIAETPITFDIEPYAVEARRPWLAQFDEHGPHRCLVAQEGDAMLGWAASMGFRSKAAYRTSVETSIYLAHGATGRGLGALLYRALFEALEGEDLNRAYAGVTLPNAASIALHERFGFERLGVYSEVGHKFGRYWDVLWLEKPLR